MTFQKAIVVIAPNTAQVVSDRPIPTLRNDYVLVKVVSVALNPTDWKHIDYISPPGVLCGCDYSGIVAEVGKGVKKLWKKGDRIAGFAHGGNSVQPEDGSFAEYIVVKGDVQFRIPDHMTFEEASTLGVGINTVMQAFYQSLSLALPTNPLIIPEPILVYGGSSATGLVAIQFAKLSGYQVLTTCSPRNFDLVKSFGADAVFDYNDTQSAAEIRKSTEDRLKLVFDTISLDTTAAFCGEALCTKGGSYTNLLWANVPRENVHSNSVLVYTIIGEDFTLGTTSIPAIPANRTFAEDFHPLVEKLLEKNFRAQPLVVGKKGLKGVLEGLNSMRKGDVSGEKLVYNISETP
ncbi:zinc-binding oxidoreductase ToxD [Penicillium odoratum]|uniref:zinc-binding oxidoreductase ToxD n=1 Tax=Penicillium odoratum TaxID=1167516 RepID=UPI002549AB57|nr:zinc-binding oxidoreductase ToxD [Penicillium odoratum]KAJ5778783.1 zinc-binding oxidoreductase ToxD [Penicillium odoratum]